MKVNTPGKWVGPWVGAQEGHAPRARIQSLLEKRWSQPTLGRRNTSSHRPELVQSRVAEAEGGHRGWRLAWGPQACRETARLGGDGAWLGKKVLDVSRHVPLVALRSQQKEVVSTPGAATARSLPAVTKPCASLHLRSDRGRAASVRNRNLTTGAIDFGKLFRKQLY